MKKDSLEEAVTICVNAICSSNIDMEDKIELMLNIDKFLSPDLYDSNIEVLNCVKDLISKKYDLNNNHKIK